MLRHRRARLTIPKKKRGGRSQSLQHFRKRTYKAKRFKEKQVKSKIFQEQSQSSPVVSVIIPVMNEHRTIRKVVAEARKVHAATEVIVVANGTKDGSDRIAHRAGARVLRYAEPLGHDVGRAVGAMEAQGEVLLFIDGDMIIPAGRLRPFVNAVLCGSDVALNEYTGPTDKRSVHRVVLAKHVLNEVLSRGDLRGMSMTAVPHALSRKALEIIGNENLSIPPVAHAIAIYRGLNIAPAHLIDVGRLNKRRTKQGTVDPLEQLIDNDHLHALRWVIEHTDSRGGYTDLDRKRHMVR